MIIILLVTYGLFLRSEAATSNIEIAQGQGTPENEDYLWCVQHPDSELQGANCGTDWCREKWSITGCEAECQAQESRWPCQREESQEAETIWRITETEQTPSPICVFGSTGVGVVSQGSENEIHRHAEDVAEVCGEHLQAGEGRGNSQCARMVFSLC